MKGYIVTYIDSDGDKTTSPLVYRFDSLNELSAKTIALQLLDEGCEDIQICEVEYTPIYKIQPGDPGIGEGCRMEKINARAQ